MIWFPGRTLHLGHAGFHKKWPRLLEHHKHWRRVMGVWVWPGNQVVPSFSLQWNSDDSTKHYLTQILLAINWHYSHGGKFMHSYEDSRSPHSRALHWNQPGVRNKIRSDFFLTERYTTNETPMLQNFGPILNFMTFFDTDLWNRSNAGYDKGYSHPRLCMIQYNTVSISGHLKYI